MKNSKVITAANVAELKAVAEAAREAVQATKNALIAANASGNKDDKAAANAALLETKTARDKAEADLKAATEAYDAAEEARLAEHRKIAYDDTLSVADTVALAEKAIKTESLDVKAYKAINRAIINAAQTLGAVAKSLPVTEIEVAELENKTVNAADYFTQRFSVNCTIGKDGLRKITGCDIAKAWSARLCTRKDPNNKNSEKTVLSVYRKQTLCAVFVKSGREYAVPVYIKGKKGSREKIQRLALTPIGYNSWNARRILSGLEQGCSYLGLHKLESEAEQSDKVASTYIDAFSKGELSLEIAIKRSFVKNDKGERVLQTKYGQVNVDECQLKWN